jgi:hypothetical protein
MSEATGNSLPSEIEAAQILIDDLQADLPSRVRRLRLLAEIETREAAGRGLIMPGGLPAQHAYIYMEALGLEVRSGMPQPIKKRPDYRDTVAACRAAGLLSENDESELRKLADRRNALAHFRDVNDPSNVERRSLSERRPPEDILEEDAAAAVAVLSKILGKPAFRFSLNRSMSSDP